MEDKKNRKGRPKKEETRSVGYRIRMTKKEYDIFNSISKLVQKPKSEVFREALDMYFRYHEKYSK